ncbi:MAG: hypothetical protein ACLR2E_22470 [Lachnospiraceae bacterium]
MTTPSPSPSELRKKCRLPVATARDRPRTVMAIRQTPPEKPDDSNGDSSDQQTPPENQKEAPRKVFLRMIRFPLIAATGKLQKLRPATVLPMKNGQGQPSMLDLTGEEQTITVTSDTVITRQTMQDLAAMDRVRLPMATVLRTVRPRMATLTAPSPLPL